MDCRYDLCATTSSVVDDTSFVLSHCPPIPAQRLFIFSMSVLSTQRGTLVHGAW